MNNVEIITNNQEREILSSWDLSQAELQEIGWVDAEELDQASFFRYRGEVYSLGDFMRINFPLQNLPAEGDPFQAWDGYYSDTYFSGILVRYTEDGEGLICGRYFS